MPREDTQFKAGGSGRPKGARNKSVIAKAQKLADSEAVNVVKLWTAVMLGDVEYLASIGVTDKIKLSDKMKASENLKSLFSNSIKHVEKAEPVEQKKPIQQGKPHFQTVARLSVPSNNKAAS